MPNAAPDGRARSRLQVGGAASRLPDETVILLQSFPPLSRCFNMDGEGIPVSKMTVSPTALGAAHCTSSGRAPFAAHAGAGCSPNRRRPTMVRTADYGASGGGRPLPARRANARRRRTAAGLVLPAAGARGGADCHGGRGCHSARTCSRRCPLMWWHSSCHSASRARPPTPLLLPPAADSNPAKSRKDSFRQSRRPRRRETRRCSRSPARATGPATAAGRCTRSTRPAHYSR